MTQTLILLFHPDLSRSRANAALAVKAAGVQGVEVVDMQAAYPNGLDLARDGAAEAVRLLAADRLVLQFPIQWYSTPAQMKAWQDIVLTRMFYIAYEAEGRRLEGMPVMLAATAGNVAEAYGPQGCNLFRMDELLAPLRATAHRCGLVWSDPFIVYKANKLAAEALEKQADAYATTLMRWITNTPLRRPVAS